MSAKQPTSPPPGSRKPEPPPAPPRAGRFDGDTYRAATETPGRLAADDSNAALVYKAHCLLTELGVSEGVFGFPGPGLLARIRLLAASGQTDPAPSGEAIEDAARAFVRAWAETGRGSVLLPKCVEGHAFDLVRAVHAAYPPAADPYNPSAQKPRGEPTNG